MRPRPSAELRPFARLALALIGVQAAQVALAWTDGLVMARLGPVELAGGGLGANLLATATLVGICVVGGVGPIVARACAAGAREAAQRTLASARVMAIAMSVPVLALSLGAAPILRWLGQPAEVADAAAAYTLGALLAFPAGVLAALHRTTLAIVGRAHWVTLTLLLAVPANAGLDVLLAFGVAPFPRWGPFGVGLATSLVSVAVALVLELLVRRTEPALLERPLAVVWARVRAIARLGIPIAVAVGAEVGVFVGAALWVGTMGTPALAAHVVALSTTQLLFLVPNGIAQTAAIRVALHRGAGDLVRVRTAARVALGGAVAWAALAAAGVSGGRTLVIDLYLDAPFVVARDLASSLLIVVAVFQIADALQVSAAGVLRGFEDTWTAMRWSAIAYLVVAPAIALALVAGAGFGVHGIWLGLAGALFVAAAALVGSARVRLRAS